MQVQTAERQELQRIIDALPENSVIAMLDFIKNLQLNENDRYPPHIPNAETAAAIRDGREGNREKTTINQIMAELNAGN